MNHPSNSNKPANKVDWDDPQLQSLLGKIEGWSLDNREVHPRRDALIQVGWGAGGDRMAALVWKRDKVLVLEADFLIPVGEHVRVHILLGDSTQVVWAVVADARDGLRPNDRSAGMRVYWLHEC